MIENEVYIYSCSDGYYKKQETCISRESSECQKFSNGDCILCNEGRYIDEGECKINTI